MRVLLVEDDAMIGSGLQLGLRQQHYTVDWVQDGEAAKLALQLTPYAMVLLDLGLPNGSGMQILSDLRNHGNHLPVIIITARDGLHDRVDGLNNGADDYLVKPFAIEELIARIRAVARRQNGQALTMLTAASLRLDPVRHLLWLNDQQTAVSAKEFALLREMMLEPGAVISREQLEDRLYGWEEEIASNAVEVHIHNIRKKLGADVICTVRGVGYRIKGNP